MNAKPKNIDPARSPGPVVTDGSDREPVVASMGVRLAQLLWARRGARGPTGEKGGIRSLRPAYGA